jgi:hypothetical protein
LLLLGVFLLALILRCFAALDYGRDWYAPGSFTLINFDEAGSCRMALEGFSYSPLVGWQTLALTAMLGDSPAPQATGDYAAAKAFCHGAAHITVARLYSALTGALTVVVLWLLAGLLFPTQPGVGLLGAGLLALSGWHIGESLMATVDAPSTFFVYAFLTAGVWARRDGGARWLLALALLLPAVWTKFWVFALCAAAALIPIEWYTRALQGVTRSRLLLLIIAYAALFGVVSNPALPTTLRYVLPFAFYPLVPWRALSPGGLLAFAFAPWLAPLAMQVDLFAAFSAGSAEGRFGTEYGAIGWHKPLRNLLNLPLVLVVGLGMPAFLCCIWGLRCLWRDSTVSRAWLVLLPVAVFALYMLFIAPVTYYRHYLPLLPAACLLAALGAARMQSRLRVAAPALLLAWQALLAWDLVTDYHHDPRRALPAWYAEHTPQRVLASYYVNSPPGTGAQHRLFRVADTLGNAAGLRRADTVILSENWYDTAFANELNGPLVQDVSRLIKTTPEAARFYRQALAGEHPLLEKVTHLRAPTFMPELLLHRRYYGSFTQFVGDIVIFRLRS